MTRRILSLLLIVLLLAAPVCAAAGPDTTGLQQSVQTCQRAVPAPDYGTEWIVILSCTASADAAYGARYWAAIGPSVAQRQGVLDSRRYTEYSRVVLAVTAAGHNAADVGGYDLTAPLQDTETVARQGINGVCYALLALDSGDYPAAVRSSYVEALLRAQLDDGGWAFSGTHADVDMTAIALQALAPYRGQEAVDTAIEAGLSRLSALQKASGGFASYGTENCESSAQVILALCQLGIGLDDKRFVKHGRTVLEAMQAYRLRDGSYCHIAGGEAANTATWQAALALCSLQRLADGLPGVYTMTARYPSFSDTAGHWAGSDIEKAVQLGLFDAGGAFRPEEEMTRGELVSALWRAAGSPRATGRAFSDVPSGAACYTAALWGRSSGVMHGVDAQRFDPSGRLTRAQLVTALWRMAGQPKAPLPAAAKQYADWTSTSSWAEPAMRWAVQAGLINGIAGQLRPSDPLTRAQAAVMLVRSLEGSKA